MKADNYGLWAERRQREQAMLAAHSAFADRVLFVAVVVIAIVGGLMGWFK